MTTALVIIVAVIVLIAFAQTVRHYADKVIEEILAAELRQIERDRVARMAEANKAARWQG